MGNSIDPQVRAEVLKDFEDSLREAGDTRTSDILARERRKYEDIALPKPGHVWWRNKTGAEYRPGLLREDGKLTVDAGSTVSETQLHMFEILPANTIPPNSESEEPTYARRWEELSDGERNTVLAMVNADDPLTAARAFGMIKALAHLPTLRNASDFGMAELDEIQDVITNYRNDPYHKRTLAIAAKVQEIQRRGTA